MGLMYTVAVEIQMDRHLQQAADQQRTITCQLPADSMLLTSPALTADQEPLRPSARLVPLTFPQKLEIIRNLRCRESRSAVMASCDVRSSTANDIKGQNDQL
jgi:hypothetical protein